MTILERQRLRRKRKDDLITLIADLQLEKKNLLEQVWAKHNEIQILKLKREVTIDFPTMRATFDLKR